MIIDSHAHIFPTRIAERAVDSIGRFYDLPMHGKGIIDDLIAAGKRHGVDGFIVNSSATSVKQVDSINSYIVESIVGRENVWGLATMHIEQDRASVDRTLRYAVDNGLVGVKLHPDFQKFCIDDRAMDNIYSACEGVLPLLMHTGDSRYEYSAPVRLANIARRYNKLQVVAAHFGGYERWHEIECYRGLDNIYIDSSSSLFKLSIERALEIIDIFGEDKLLFGVDYPMWNYIDELARFAALNLSRNACAKAYCDNAVKLYKLKPMDIDEK